MTADYTAAVRRGQAWVAAVDGEVAGFIILFSRPGYLLLENVAVLPAAQGRGIGARLLALAEDRARALHVPEIRLYTNAAMTEDLAYYRRHGYTETTGPSRTASTVSSSANGWTPDRPNRANEDVGLSHYPGGCRSPHGEAVQRGPIPATFALRP
jgi:N-acetylglutamate synthase-like GNAT family acetyltransferase